MAFNPQRSWAVTYNQMWNLSMKDPIPKGGNKNSQFMHYSNGQAVKGGNNTQRRNKSDYCWNFNKGVPRKFGAKCKFVEKCKYCDS